MADALIDAAARATAVDAGSSLLVQAPAGSGKTTVLTQRYLRLLAEVDAPEQILALTFTRRAALEMRERVLAALRAARLPQRPASMDERTWKLAVDAAAQLRRRDLDMESQPSRLRIDTIDAFNSWLAAQLPVASGAGAGIDVLEDARASYREAARRALAYEGDDVFGAAVERVLALDDLRWSSLVQLIADMLPSRDRWLPLLAGRMQATLPLDEPQLQALRNHFDQDLQLLLARALQNARHGLGAELLGSLAALAGSAARRLAGGVPWSTEWRDNAGPLRAEIADLPRWRCLARVLLTKSGQIRRAVNKAQGFPPRCAEKPVMMDMLAQLQASPHSRGLLRELRDLPAPCYGPEQWSRVREVAQVLVLAAAQLDGVLRERGASDFPGISMAALRALGSEERPTDLNLRLDYRLQHILVDEFQDTSSAQLRLLRLLTAGWQRGDGRSVFCVGDPMQSIYGFRQAEVRAFLELAELGIGDVRFDVQRLQSNFRSAPEIVAWINARFASIMPQRDDRNRGAIAYRPSSAALPRCDAAGGVTTRAYPNAAAEAQDIARRLQAELRRHPQWRIAILVRARLHARQIAAALHAHGIAFRASQIEALQDRAVVRDIIMLTRALLHLGDRIAWLAVLRAPWAGLSLSDLWHIARVPLIWDALHDEGVMQLLDVAARTRCTRLRAAFQAAMDARNTMPLARWVESTWLRLGGPECAATAEELSMAAAAFARLRLIEQQGMPDPAQLQDAFEDLYADQGETGAVEIMTIHKAKGLEFDMVVVPALQRAVAAQRGQLLLVHEFARNERDGMVMAARPPVAAEDELFDFLQAQARAAAALEAQRLLYVACTRAKSQLLLTACLEPPATSREFTPRNGSLLAVLWPVAAADFALPPQATTACEPVESMSDAPRGGPLSRLPADWLPLLPTFETASAAPSQSVEWPDFDWAGETARCVGNLVHAELQFLDPQRVNEAAIRGRSAQFAGWLEAHGVPAERLTGAAQRVVDALLAIHRDARGRWILAAGYRDDLREHALSGLLAGRVVRAVFDRSFVDAGVRWVIDYKTSQHGGGGLQDFLDREVERYRPQLQRYALLAQRLGPEPVRLGLYFPLLQAWREWAA